MDRLLSRLHLPLLTKELLEQAARRRTWIVRSAYLGLLFLIFFTAVLAIWDGNNVQSMLGGGAHLFNTLLSFQWWGVYILVPLTCFGLITAEKERDSLQLLFLTRLGPWTILFEKLLSRLLPMSLFLIAALPILAVAYSYGGVSPEMLSNAVLCLFSTAFFMASIAIMFSCYAFVSTQAFFGTLAFSVLTMLLPLAGYLFIHQTYGRGFITTTFPVIQNEELLAGAFFGPVIFWSNQLNGFETCFYWNLPQLIYGAGCLVVARICLTSRAFVGKTSTSRRTRIIVDRAANTVLNRSSVDLPELKNPVTWIERRQGLSGRPAYLVGLLTFLGTVLAIGAGVTAAKDWLTIYAGMSQGIFWIIAPLIVCGKAAGSFGTERARQTLDVLLTTPLQSKEIVRQKMGGTWPLILFLLAMFLILAIIGVASAHTHEHQTQPLPLAVLATMLTATVTLSMVAWMSVAISLRTKTAARATTYAVTAIVGWCIGPWLFFASCAAFSRSGMMNEEPFIALAMPMMSPSFFAGMSVSGYFSYRPLNDWYLAATVWNTVLYGGAALLFRWYSLKTAASALDRPDRE